MFRELKEGIPEFMELYVIDGDYGLPSLDIDCVKSILFTRAATAPVKEILRKGIITCSLYSTPTIVINDSVYTGFKDISRQLRRCNYNIDGYLSARQASNFCAVQSLIETDLVPVLNYLQWIDHRNVEELSGPWHMKALPFPFNFYYVKQKKTSAAQLIEAIYPGESDEAIREYLRKSATVTLSALSNRLGNLPYFHGETISTLDVVVYASLTPFIKIPYPSTEITSLITMWPNLLHFVKRIDLNYFPDVGKGPKYLVQKEKVQQNDDEMSYLTMFLLFTGATTIMLCFAVNKGIIKVE